MSTREERFQKDTMIEIMKLQSRSHRCWSYNLFNTNSFVFRENNNRKLHYAIILKFPIHSSHLFDQKDGNGASERMDRDLCNIVVMFYSCFSTLCFLST